MFPVFTIFGRTVGTYAVCAFIGLLACGVTACLLGKRKNIPPDDVILFMLIAAGGLFLGGHILYGVTNTGKIAALIKSASDLGAGGFLRELVICFGGMVFYGGLIGAAAAVCLYSKKAKIPDGVDVFVVCVPLFHTFGRIGCFLGGCCYGVESRFGFIGPVTALSPGFGGVRRFPIQLVEAVCNLAIFFVLLYLYQKGKGRPMIGYLFLYPPVRFVLEFFRGDAIRGFLFGLSTSQWISIFLFAAAAVRTIRRRRAKQNFA